MEVYRRMKDEKDSQNFVDGKQNCNGGDKYRLL